jgi:hypothetical protein
MKAPVNIAGALLTKNKNMTSQIENSKAYKQLHPFQQKLVLKRDNRKQVEDAIIIARTIGYANWAASSPMSHSWREIVKELV